MKTSNRKKKKPNHLQGTKVSIYVLLLLLMLATLSVWLSGCKTSDRLPRAKNESTESETLISEKDKLTPVAIPGDSTKFRALFECDSLNNVLMIAISEGKSKNMSSSVSFRNGQLDYSATTKPDTVFVKSTDKIFKQKTKKTITIHITKVVKQYGFLWWSGLVSWIIITATVVIKIARIPGVKKAFKFIYK